jgi:hypothetical protein
VIAFVFFFVLGDACRPLLRRLVLPLRYGLLQPLFFFCPVLFRELLVIDRQQTIVGEPSIIITSLVLVTPSGTSRSK